MTDFAGLAIVIDSSGVPRSVADLDKLTAAGAKAEKQTEDLGRASARSAIGMATATASAGQQRAGMQQLSFQIGDVAQQFAVGTNPMIIWAQQSGQVIQALTLMRGGAGGLIGFLGGPWGAALTGAATVASMLAMKLYQAEDATKKVEFASYALKDAQSILGGVFDLTTGKINNQSTALQALAQAQLLVARVQAQARQAEARSQIVGMQDKDLKVGGGMGGGVYAGYQQRPAAGISQRILDGTNTPKQALDQLENLRKVGRITAQEFMDGASAIANYGVETENLTVLGKGLTSMLDGKLDPALVRVTKSKKDAKEKVDRLAESLARNSKAVEAQIAGLHTLADAYLEGDAAALKAEVSAKATADGIKKRADVEAHVAQQIRLSVAERTADAAKSVASMGAENDARQLVNNQVAQGLMTAEEAQRFLRDEAQLRPVITALAVAEGAEKERLTKIIAGLRGEQRRANDEIERAQSLARRDQNDRATSRIGAETGIDAETGRKRIAILSADMPEFAQRDALRALNAEREKAMILMQAEADIRDRGKSATAEEIASIRARADAEANQVDVRTKLDSVSDAVERLKSIKDSFSFGSVFGEFGDGVDGMVASLRQLADAQAAYEAVKQNGSTADVERERAKFTDAQTAATLNTLGATKKLFGEQSAGYKAITALEKAFAAIKLINTIKSMVLDTTHTGTSVANSMTRATADQAAGASKMFSFLGPFAFPAVAAMIALLAGLGVKGGSGGGAGNAPMTAEQMQAAQGAGTVLGDPTAKSASIANSLQLMAENTNKQLEYSNGMLNELRKIESGITALASALARQLSLSGGAFDTGKFGLGSSGSAGVLGLFASSTTRTLYDQGIEIFSTSLASAIANGIGGQTYNIVEQVKKKSGFLGIGGGTKTTYQTYTDGLDSDVSRQIQLILGNLRDTTVEAAKIIGFDVKSMLDNFQVEIGRISLQGLKGDEITQALGSVFSKVADQMAGFAVTGLDQFQKVGEGLFETLSRVAKNYITLDVSLKSIGLTFGSVGAASIAARESLVDLFGGLDELTSQTDFYRSNFLTDAEQIAPVISSVADEMVRLGLASVDTLAEFKGVINGLDLTTAAGQQTYAALMAVAPAFSSIIKYQDKLAKSYDDQASSLRSYLSDLLGKGSSTSLATAQAVFKGTATKALLGDLEALGALKGVSTSFLDAAKQNAKSPLDYARARAEVLRTVGQAANVADDQAAVQRQQLAAAQETAATLASMRAEINQLNAQSVSNTSSIAKALAYVTDGDAIKVTSLADTPFTVDVAA